ncbi:MAG TPA: MBL fold metallo-hydrolase [Solirubrobacteraceae bacterium]|nr:MBL fold metallo-hydrolase [Solirubrobacteraceae bacterium]
MNVELIVLGSGGPFINARRTSSCYMLHDGDGRRLLIDAGGGAFERFGRAGLGAADLDAVLLTHLHIDHSGGLAPLVFSAYMEGRHTVLPIAGPQARGGQPGVAQFAQALFGTDGAWSYLHSFEGFGIRALEAPSDPADARPAEVLTDGHLRVRAVAVPHGMMPSVAYRVDVDGRSVVFSGDVESEHAPLVELAAGCDVLVHDFALPEREVEHGHLHAKPSAVGRVANACGCRTLVLSHVMPELEDELEPALELVRATYRGRLVLAGDLTRIAV